MCTSFYFLFLLYIFYCIWLLSEINVDWLIDFVYSMDNFCLPVHAGDFISDGDLWRACGYLRSPSPPPQSTSSAGRENASSRAGLASLRSPGVDDDARQSSSASIDVYHDQQHHPQQQQQQREPVSPIDDISNETMFSFSARAQSSAYRSTMNHSFIHSFLYCQQMSKRIRCYIWPKA